MQLHEENIEKKKNVIIRLLIKSMAFRKRKTKQRFITYLLINESKNKEKTSRLEMCKCTRLKVVETRKKKT
jgi:hypothetical protein